MCKSIEMSQSSSCIIKKLILPIARIVCIGGVLMKLREVKWGAKVARLSIGIIMAR